MNFKKIIHINKTKFEISPDIKRFSLRDLGFFVNNKGFFIKIINLEPEKKENSIKMKITFKDDLTAFKILFLSANKGIKIDIFKIQDNYSIVEQYRFVMKQLLVYKVLERG